MTSSPLSPTLSRRLLLTGAGAGLIGLTAGCTTLTGGGEDIAGEGMTCVPRERLNRSSTLAGFPLVYEITQDRTAFWFESGFFDQLTTWVSSLADALAIDIDQVWTYGTWIDGGETCGSWHNSGRGFDLARLRLGRDKFLSVRYDLWKNQTGPELEASLRSYWRLAATLHQHFAYVLTYLFNEAHHNHIHVDNGRSGSGLSTFSSRSRAQVQGVQAICTHLWNSPVELTGRWDVATRRACDDILQRLSLPGSLDDPETWQAFLTASAAQG